MDGENACGQEAAATVAAGGKATSMDMEHIHPFSAIKYAVAGF